MNFLAIPVKRPFVLAKPSKPNASSYLTDAKAPCRGFIAESLESYAKPGANHQRNHADDHDNQHRDGSACRNGCHHCMSGRPQRFEAHHNHIGHSFDRLLGCFPGCSCSLFSVLHNFGSFGLCRGGSCCARGSGGGRLGQRHRPRLRFLPRSYLESGQRIVPQTALVEISRFRRPHLTRSHLRGG